VTIRAITDIRQGAISKRFVIILEGNKKKPKYQYVNNAFFSFDKVETHCAIRYYPTILHS
jgi:hypothetical protein